MAHISTSPPLSFTVLSESYCSAWHQFVKKAHSDLVDDGDCMIHFKPNNDTLIIVGWRGRTIVCAGTICFIREPFLRKPADLTNIVVRADLRCQGIGTQLVNHLLERAKKRESPYATVTVDDSNTAAKKLYEKVGFKPMKNGFPGQYWIRLPQNSR
jgi:ribosomal protein S18 acetylase RimI-like enzyme